MNTIRLSPATSSENLHALEEVKQFGRTDMGRGGLEQWAYRVLSDEEATAELERIASFHTLDEVDSATIQPSPYSDDRTQDRHIVEKWDLPEGVWTFAAVFDGHAGHDVVDYAVARLPLMIKQSLDSTLRGSVYSAGAPLPQAVCSLLSGCIMKLDDTITREFLNVLPNGAGWVSRASDASIEALVDDRSPSPDSGRRTGTGLNYAKALRCVSGATALLALVDPSRSHLWIANLGDSYAVLGACDPTTGNYTSKLLHSLHNASVPEEAARIEREHPGENGTCVQNYRVLGFLSPTRALGDTWLKIPRIYSDRVFLPMGGAGWAAREVVQDTLARHHTPPYVSNVPDVRYYDLEAETSSRDSDLVLVLASDGLYDLYSERDDVASMQDILKRWVTVAIGARHSVAVPVAQNSPMRRRNTALAVLKDGLGGSNTDALSINLTVEMEEKWMDDTTVVVLHLR